MAQPDSSQRRLRSDEFDHVILTRFSAVLDNGKTPPEPEWLRYRLGFFIDACLPSVLGQSVSDFRWLVWFDDRCPDDFRADVESLVEDSEGRLEAVWTHDDFWADLPRRVAPLATSDHLLTTRLDSDDAIARDFVESLHQELMPTDRLAIDFPWGLQVDRSRIVYADHLRSNHFISLLQRRDQHLPRMVFEQAHPKLRRVAPVRHVLRKDMWLEVVHGTNLSNGVR